MPPMASNVREKFDASADPLPTGVTFPGVELARVRRWIRRHGDGSAGAAPGPDAGLSALVVTRGVGLERSSRPPHGDPLMSASGPQIGDLRPPDLARGRWRAGRRLTRRSADDFLFSGLPAFPGMRCAAYNVFLPRRAQWTGRRNIGTEEVVCAACCSTGASVR
jgi:hypothetical protein